MEKILKSDNISPDNKQLLGRVMEELGHEDRSYFDKLTQEEAGYVLKMLEEYGADGDSSTHKILWELDYDEKPVTIQQFLGDHNYMGRIGDDIYDFWKQELDTVLCEGSRIIEWIMTGAIGIGKTTVANVAQSYKLYRLLCLKDPRRYYGLAETKPIGLALFNITLDRAWSVNWESFKSVLLSMPWFADQIKMNATESWIELPKNVNIVIGSQQTHALGADIISASMDENDFTKSVGGQQVLDNYNAIYRRMTSRFADYMYTSSPGLLTLASSATQDEMSFTNKREKLIEDDPHSHVTRESIWNVKKHMSVYKDSKKFPVFIGDELRPPRILQASETLETRTNNEGETLPVYDKLQLIWVPDFHRKDFEQDIDTSILDLAGIRIGSRKNKFLRRKDLLYKCLTNTEGHMFSHNQLKIIIDSPDSIKKFFYKDKFFNYFGDAAKDFRPKINPKSPRFIHIDLSKTGDMTGISCVHLYGYYTTEVEVEGKIKKVNKPIIYQDFSIAITSIVGSEIDFEKIREFIVYLIGHGLDLKGISYDQYQSVDSLQYFKKNQLVEVVETVSVDRTDEPYMRLRSLIVDGRLMLYRYEALLDEILDLERDLDRGKVDHPADGSKDISDSLCGATYQCIKYAEDNSAALLPMVGNFNSDQAWTRIKKNMETMHIKDATQNRDKKLKL